MPFRVLLYLHFLYFLEPLNLAGGGLYHRFVGYYQPSELLVCRKGLVYFIYIAADDFFNSICIFSFKIILHIIDFLFCQE